MDNNTKKTDIIVDQKGVQFGPFCWISHDHIMGVRESVINSKYKEWFRDLQMEDGHRLTMVLDLKDKVKSLEQELWSLKEAIRNIRI